MNEYFCISPLQGLQGKLDPALEQFRCFRLKVVISRVPEHVNSKRLRQWSIVKLDLHVYDVRDSGARDFGHVFRCPNSATEGHTARDPREIHSRPSISRIAGELCHP